MIKGFIRTGYDRETLFGEGMKNADVLKCTASFGLNKVDGADLTLPATNRPARSLLQKNAIVELRQDSETVFIGEVATVLRNELGDIRLELDGALGWLRSVCKAPFSIKPTDPNGPVENFLTAIFAQYNAAVPVERQLQLGSVTVAGGVSMDHSGEYVTMLDLLREVREQRGGYIYVDYVTGLPTVHYVAALSQASVQTLEFGANVLTVEDQLDFTDYASRVYATGTYYVTTTVDGQEKREQKPVDAGYVSDADAEALYGRADLSYRSDTDMGGDKDNDIPDKTQAEAIAIIQAEAQAILDEHKTPLRSLDMTAVELAEIGADYRLFKVGTVARALVQILNINTTLAVRSVKRDFIDAGNSTVSFGKEAATISGASFGGGGSASGGGSGGSGQVGPQGPAGPQGPQGVQGPQGPAGADGADGVSPTVTVTEITGGHRVTITDADGTETFDVMDGSGSGSENVVAMSKVNGAWQLDSGMWRVLWNHYTDEILLITTEGNDVRHLYKVGLSYTNSSSITSVDIYFSDQRYNGRTAEGRAFKITVPETGTGTITEITGADIPTSGGGGGSGSYIKFNLNESTLAVTDSSGTAATGRMILNACWSNSVELYGTERTSSSLKYNCYHLLDDDLADGEFVRFFRPTSDGVVVIKIGAAETTATKTVIPYSSASGHFVRIDYNNSTGAVTHNGTAITGSEIATLLSATDTGVVLVGSGSTKYVYELIEVRSNNEVVFKCVAEGVYDMIVTVPSNSSTATLDLRRKPSAWYYIDGTTIKSGQTNYAVTGTQIGNAMDSSGIPPVVYQYDSVYVGNLEFHLFAQHSGGLVFRTLDGSKEFTVGWDSSTVTVNSNGGDHYDVFAVLSGSSYTLRANTTSSSRAITASELFTNRFNLRLNRSLPCEKIIYSEGWNSYLFIDKTNVGETGFDCVVWQVDASANSGVTVTRTVVNLKTTKYAVTLNADGTVRSKVQALTYSTVFSKLTKQGVKDSLIVTWGNTVFEAPVVETVDSTSNGDIKFIGLCEYDGIQRYIVFTLAAVGNTLTTTVINTFALKPAVIYNDSTGLAALETDMSASPSWQLTNLDLTPFKRIKIYTKAAQKSGATASASTTPSAMLEMLLDPVVAGPYGGHYLASLVIQKSNDRNRLATLTCAVSSDKTKFAVMRQTNLYGTGASDNSDVGSNVVRIEGYYD